MELKPLDPETKPYDIPLDDDLPEAPPEKSPKRKKRRLWLLAPALLAAALALALALNATALRVRLAPLHALREGFAALAPLPDPGVYGFLGEVTRDGVGLNCSGTLQLQTGEDGLRVLARDVTLGGELYDLDFSGYLSAHDAALIAPGLTGGSHAWYGVSLDGPIRDQSVGTGGDPDYGWYFDEGDVAAFQTAADGVRDRLSQVTDLGPAPAEREALAAALDGCTRLVTRASGYVISFELTDDAADAAAELFGLPGGSLGEEARWLRFTLNPDGVLREVWLTGERVNLSVYLGDEPDQTLTPRLDLTLETAAGTTWTATLAITAEPGGPVEAPHYTNAFTLLPRVDD